MIGKIIADFSGLTEKWGGEKNGGFDEIKPIKLDTEVNTDKWDKFKQEVKAANGDTVKIKAAIDNSELKQLKNLDGLYDYAVKQSSAVKDVDLDSVNNLIQAQNYKNIANQAHGTLGVNAAIKEYNKLTDAASKNKLAETINSTNSSLGKYLTGLDGATAGMGEYISSLATATVKTFTLKAVTMAFNMGTSLAISAVITKAVSAISNYVNAAKIARENTEALSSSLAESQNKYAEDSKKIGELSSRYETLSKDVNHLGQNVSLSSSQYDEYKSIIKQLSEIMPDLTLRFNEQSEAILD